MRLICMSQVIIFFIVVSMITDSHSQTNWTKYLGNPVMDVGPDGSWDDEDVGIPVVIWVDSIYHMWYTGSSGGWNTYRVGYAISDDGISWTKHLENPIPLLGSSESWDGVGVQVGPVLYDGDLFKMWYGGYDGTLTRTGYATSINGITWEKYNDAATIEAPFAESDPVLDLGTWDSWEAHVLANSVIFENEIYKMWYVGYSNDFSHSSIGYATSVDGIHWQKDTLNNPVLVKGSPGTWDDWYVDTPSVLFNGDYYEMWYTGEAGVELDPDDNCIGYATSVDGISWQKYDDPTTTAPLFAESDPVLRFGPDLWDSDEIWCGNVLLQNDVYKMWYVGVSGDSFIERICYAEDFSNIAHADNFNFDKTYFNPGADSLQLEAHIINPHEHTLNVKAQFFLMDSIIVDSTNLLEQENGIWGGKWAVPAGEKIYDLGIKTVDDESGTIHNGIMWNVEKFTTIGPIEIESIEIVSNDTVPNPGDQIDFDLELINNGLLTTATDITATMVSLDTSCAVVRSFDRSFGDLEAGSAVFGNRPYRVEFLESCTDVFSVSFRVDISTGNLIFWSDTFSVVIIPSAIEKTGNKLPATYSLKQNYPNPFNPVTMINYQLPITSDVELSVYNLLGQKVTTLVSGKKNAGYHQVGWDASGFSSGLYYYKIEAGEFQDVKKMILLR